MGPDIVTVRVLSVKQPAADHIVFGDKWCENRTWTTRYRGELYIHATRWEGSSGQWTPGAGLTGAIIGRVQLADVVDLRDELVGRRGGAKESKALRQAASRLGLSTGAAGMAHVLGPVCFILSKPQKLLRPISTKGQLNIWRFQGSASQLQVAPGG